MDKEIWFHLAFFLFFFFNEEKQFLFFYFYYFIFTCVWVPVRLVWEFFLKETFADIKNCRPICHLWLLPRRAGILSHKCHMEGGFWPRVMHFSWLSLVMSASSLMSAWRCHPKRHTLTQLAFSQSQSHWNCFRNQSHRIPLLRSQSAKLQIAQVRIVRHT